MLLFSPHYPPMTNLGPSSGRFVAAHSKPFVQAVVLAADLESPIVQFGCFMFIYSQAFLFRFPLLLHSFFTYINLPLVFTCHIWNMTEVLVSDEKNEKKLLLIFTF
jgi:hypothetical protein